MLEDEPRYAEFKAYRQGQVWVYERRLTPDGSNDYWSRERFASRPGPRRPRQDLPSALDAGPRVRVVHAGAGAVRRHDRSVSPSIALTVADVACGPTIGHSAPRGGRARRAAVGARFRRSCCRWRSARRPCRSRRSSTCCSGSSGDARRRRHRRRDDPPAAVDDGAAGRRRRSASPACRCRRCSGTRWPIRLRSGISSGASLGVALVVLGSGIGAAAAFGAPTGLRGDALITAAAIAGAVARPRPRAARCRAASPIRRRC